MFRFHRKLSLSLMMAGMALLLGVAPAWAAGVVERAGDKMRYDNCLAQAGLNPAQALGVASNWIADRGGAPAEHCAAVALVGLKRYAEAGAKLDMLGHAPGVGELRPSLLDQAGNAWLLAGDAPHAVGSFEAALTLSGNDPDLYADLARAQALQKDWRSVEADMNAALAIAPRRADLLLLRASARHALGKLPAARADADAAVALRANYSEALLERGSIARDAGDAAAARKDFESVANGNGAIGDSARSFLASLDDAAKPVAKPKKK